MDIELRNVWVVGRQNNVRWTLLSLQLAADSYPQALLAPLGLVAFSWNSREFAVGPCVTPGASHLQNFPRNAVGPYTLDAFLVGEAH